MRTEDFKKVCIDIPCWNCNGAKTIKTEVPDGFLTTKIVDVPCSKCNGTGLIKIAPWCHYAAARYGSECEGSACNMWDREHDGGCLDRKARMKELYG
jgi:DnaJ-class molecular chaperone